MKRGTQIAYIPTHAGGDINHPDVQFGFVTSERGDTVFCRFWSKHSPGELCTKANSEGADRTNIVEHVSRSQSSVNAALAEIDAG